MRHAVPRGALGDAALDRISVVILNWNGREDTLACLRSLEATAPAGTDVIVVDNASDDDSADAIRQAHPEVRVLEMERNLGFSGGNNAGIAAALAGGAEAVLVLNNDTELQPGAIEALRAPLIADPAMAAASPLILFAEPRDVVWFAGATFDPRRARSGRMLGYRRRLGPWVDRLPRTTDRCVGAAMLVRAEAVERVGPLPEEYFFLYEDVDWSLRFRRAGYRLGFVPEARVLHKVAASHDGSAINPSTLYYLTRNHLLVCGRHAPQPRLRGALRTAGVVVVHLLEAARARPRSAAVCSVWAGWRDHRRGRTGPRPA